MNPPLPERITDWAQSTETFLSELMDDKHAVDGELTHQSGSRGNSTAFKDNGNHCQHE